MSTPVPRHPAAPRIVSPLLSWIGAIASLSCAVAIMAQSVVVSPPVAPLAPGVIRATAVTDSPLAPNYNEAVSGNPITIGQFRIHPSLFTSYMQANGLPSGQGVNIDTTIFTFSPSLTADVGEHWILNYSPSWVNYSAAKMQDSVNQNFQLIGATAADAWMLHFSEGFQSSLAVLAETAQQTKQHTWDTTVSGTRNIGTHSSYDGSVSLNERYADVAPDARTWSTQHWLRSQVSPKVNAGIGVHLSWIDFTSAKRANTDSIQYLGQLNWKPSNKINLSAQGGLEAIRSKGSGTETKHNPTHQVTLGYQPFEHTTLTIVESDTVANSYFDDTLTKNKGWNVSLNQRLLEKLQLTVTYGDQTSDYITFGGNTTPDPSVRGRSDDLTTFNSTLSIQLFQHWTLSAIYSRSKNDSSLATTNGANFNFTTTQYGLQLSAKF